MKRFYFTRLVLVTAILLGWNWSAHAQSTTFSSVGGPFAYTVPQGITAISLDLAGAQGGSGYGGHLGGKGGHIQCTLAVSGGQVLNVYVGGKGTTSTGCCATFSGGTQGTGGANGGNSGSSGYGGGGGAASDIRSGGTGLANRIVVAAGGGGGADWCGSEIGGDGGGANGSNGQYCGGNSTCCDGQGASISSGGSGATYGGTTGGLGNGGNGGYEGGGGGGGYYGGGGGYYGSGGGGSSFPVVASGNISNLINTGGFQTANGYVTICAPNVGTVTGPGTACTGSSSTLSSSGTAGGTWSSSNTAVATVGSGTGVVTGVAVGTATISYSITNSCGSGSATMTITINASPAAISGAANGCLGGTTTLSDAGGGTWSSSNIGVAIAGTSGIITGASVGTATITYTLPVTGCIATLPFTVNPLPAAIAGTTNVCIGATTALSDVTPGGSWSSSNPGVAFVSGGGVVTGASAGTANITYTLPTGCLAVTPVLVNPQPNAIAGSGNVCTGATTTLTDAGGGTWSSSNTAVAAVNSAGVVSGVSPGSATITYTLPTGCNTTAGMVVNPLPLAITGTTAMCAGFTTTLSDSTSGGTWSSSNTAMATVNSAGVVTGVSAGSPNILYTLATGCAAIKAVNVNPLPTAFAVTGGGGYCIGGPGVHVSLASSTGGVKYKLFNGATLVDSANGSGAGLDFGLKTATGSYTVVATNATTGCVNNMSGSVTVSINPLPAVYNVTGGGSYCSGGTGVHINLSNSNTGVNYQLYNGLVSVGSMTGVGGALDFGPYTAAGTYTVVATNLTSSCTANMAGSASVSINPLPVVYNLNSGGSYCIGGTGVDVVLSGSDATNAYQLYYGTSLSGGPLTGTGSALHFGLHTAAGSYTVVATNTSTGCVNNMAGTTTITINPLPVVYTVTGGGSYCLSGAGVHVNLNYSNSGINYQLYRGVVAVGSPVAGSNSGIDFGLQTIAGTYTVVATNATTGCTINMAGSAVVSINPLPNVFNVTGGGAYCVGGSGLHVGLSGSNIGMHYQLYNGTAPVGTPVAGTGSALNFGIFTAVGAYTVVATNITTSCTNTMSGTATITTNSLPVAYTLTAAGTSYCAGGAGIEILSANSDTSINYQLYRGSTPTGPVMPGTGAGISFGFQTIAGTYKVIATNPATGCSGPMSNNVSISVNPAPTAFTVTGGGSYCSGGAGVHIGLSGSGVGVNYQLYNNVTTTVGSPVAGYGSSIDFGAQVLSGPYTVIATDATNGCTTTMSSSANIIVNALPTIYTVTGGGNYCTGGTGVHVFNSGSDLGIVYQLYNGTATVGSPMAGTSLGLDFGLQTATGNYTVVAYNPLTTCSSNMISSALIGLTPLPTAQVVTGGGAYCAGGAGMHVGLSSSNIGVTYQLYHGTALGGPLNGTGTSIDFGLKTLAGGYTVIATDTTTHCTNNMTGTVSISITPQPTVKNVTGGGSYCIGGTGIAIGLNGSNSGIQYQLYNGATPVGSVMAGTGGTLSFGLQAAPGTYTVIASPGGLCQTTMAGNAPVTTTPLPTAYAITGGGGYCSGTAGVDIGLSLSGLGVNYQLYNGIAAVGSPVPGTGSAIDFGSQTAVGNYSVVATDLTSTCTNNMTGSGAISIALLPAPHVFNVAGGGHYCAGGTGAVVTLGGSNTNVNYQLRNGTVNVGTPLPGTGTILDFGLQTAQGNYMVVATDAANSCTTTMSDTAKVIVDPINTPAFTIAAHPGNTIKMGQSDTIAVNVTAGGGTNPSYQWSVNSFPISGATSSKYMSAAFANGDVVSCQVTSDGPCSGAPVTHSVTLTVLNTTAVTTLTASGSDVRVMPNPNKGAFTISGTLGTTEDEEVSLEVTDMIGHVVYTTKAIARNGNISEKIQLNNIANGMYILSMRSSVENKVFHIVIEQ